MTNARKRSSQTETLGGVLAQAMSDARRGIQRCDRYVVDGYEQCGRIATSTRWDPRMKYDHPFCATHVAEWDATPECER